MGKAKEFASCHYKTLTFKDREGEIGLEPSTQTAAAAFDGKPHLEYLPENYQQYFLELNNYSSDNMQKIADEILTTISKWTLAKEIHLRGGAFYTVLFDDAEKLQVLENLTLLTIRVGPNIYDSLKPVDILKKIPQVDRFELIPAGVSTDDLRKYETPWGYYRIGHRNLRGEDKIVFAKLGQKRPQ